jgi:hypothetical protein
VSAPRSPRGRPATARGEPKPGRAQLARGEGCRIDVVEREGKTVVSLENRSVRIGVMPTKGADIVELRRKALDLDLLWHGPHRL